MTSVLTRQKRDHTELDRLPHEIDAASDSDRQHALNRLCRLVFPHAFAGLIEHTPPLTHGEHPSTATPR
ncbi:hypothetical protein [Mycobacterium kyogaense]|uniref:hypothetical protein n=1 Tax=Mycobacterium kyogaense TaxID=2212479 RepID=UPI000DAD71BC|nr:hypothetical protein [Mycobacterium kyogaense]